jgi:hypothetical protein
MNQEFRLLRARLPSSFLRVSNTTLISTLRRTENSRALSVSRFSMRFLRRLQTAARMPNCARRSIVKF